MSETQAIQQLQERVDHLEMKIDALMVKEGKATKAELKAMKKGHEEIAVGHFVTLDQIRARLKKK
ncbi:MAG: hypothetical protein AABX02_01465 [archaeon]